MNREHYRTSQEQVAFEFGLLILSYQQARAQSQSKSNFARLMNQASAQGKTWVDGLKSVLENRDGRGVDLEGMLAQSTSRPKTIADSALGVPRSPATRS